MSSFLVVSTFSNVDKDRRVVDGTDADLEDRRVVDGADDEDRRVEER
jgi:hypothetical protein